MGLIRLQVEGEEGGGMRYAMILVLAVLLAGSCFAEFRIAKDRTPGGLYVVGPDISPDSSEGQFLYYSPDSGMTLVVKDSSGYSGIGADYVLGNIYKEVFETIYHSDDYGASWSSCMHGAGLFTGAQSGEFYAFNGYCFGRALEFGDSFYCVTTWDGFNTGCLGWQPGELFLLDQIWGFLYYSSDTMLSTSEVYSFGYHGCDLITSGRSGEIYGLSSDSIYYSADYGSTFVGTNTFSLEPEESSLMEIVGGGFSGELYGVYVDYHVDEYYEQHGGNIRICYSRNYGATFTCLSHTAEGITFDTLTGIDESQTSRPSRLALYAYPNPFNSAVTISAPAGAEVEVFDVKGRRVAELASGDQFWKPEPSVGSGVYLVRAKIGDGQTATKRVVYLK